MTSPILCALLLLASLGGVPGAAPVAPPASATTPDVRRPPVTSRDPFVSLLAGAETHAAQGAADGLAGMRSAELVIRGVVHGARGALAMVEGADHRTYIARPGSRLLDGTVTSIGDAGIVVERRADNPALKTGRREVTLSIATTEGVKP